MITSKMMTDDSRKNSIHSRGRDGGGSNGCSDEGDGNGGSDDEGGKG